MQGNYIVKKASRSFVKFAVFLTLLFILVFIFKDAVSALTKSFSQTSWAGGADTNATITEQTGVGWNKYYSESSGIDSSAGTEIKLKLQTTQP